MKTVKEISKGENYTAVSVGRMADLNQHKYTFAPGIEIPGKVFLSSELQSAGVEISFQTFASGAESGFLHMHKSNAEVYLFVSGSGEFQVDGDIFPVSEGSVIRIATKGLRSVRNTGSESLVMICLQYKEDSVINVGPTDGIMCQEQVVW